GGTTRRWRGVRVWSPRSGSVGSRRPSALRDRRDALESVRPRGRRLSFQLREVPTSMRSWLGNVSARPTTRPIRRAPQRGPPAPGGAGGPHPALGERRAQWPRLGAAWMRCSARERHRPGWPGPCPPVWATKRSARSPCPRWKGAPVARWLWALELKARGDVNVDLSPGFGRLTPG